VTSAARAAGSNLIVPACIRHRLNRYAESIRLI
jgi:hypothetical protein